MLLFLNEVLNFSGQNKSTSLVIHNNNNENQNKNNVTMKKAQLRSNMISMIIVTMQNYLMLNKMQLSFDDTDDTKNGIQFNDISATSANSKS